MAADSKTPNAVLVVQGKMLDSADSPLGDATIIPYLNGKPYKPALNVSHSEKDSATGRNGLFMMEISAPAEKIKDGNWALKITRPSFKPSQVVPLKIFADGADEKGIANVRHIGHGEDAAIPGHGLLDRSDNIPDRVRSYSV